jgi:hypothetical protein
MIQFVLQQHIANVVVKPYTTREGTPMKELKQITFRELQTNTKWLDELPVEVTRYGKVIATILGKGKLVESAKKDWAPVDMPKAKRDTTKVVNGLCKHNSFGWCVHGCFGDTV